MDILTSETIDVFLMLATLGWLGLVSGLLMVGVNVFKWAAPGAWAKAPRWLQTLAPLLLGAAGAGIAVWKGAEAGVVIPFAAASAGLSFVNHKVAKALAVIIDKRWGSRGSADYKPSKLSRGLSLVTHVSVDGQGNLKPPAVGSARMGR